MPQSDTCSASCKQAYNRCINDPCAAGPGACVPACKATHQDCQDPCIEDCVDCARAAKSWTANADCRAQAFTPP